MKAKGFTPAGRGVRRRLSRRPGGRGQPSGCVARDIMPPRDRADMTCLNCNRKGHAGSECRQPTKEKAVRLCFLCNTPGHAARACPNKPPAPPRPIKAIEDAGAPRRTPLIFFVTEKPKSQPAQFGDFIRAAPARKSANIFQPLSLSVWQGIATDVAAERSQTDVIESSPVLTLDLADFPPLPTSASIGQGEIDSGIAHSSFPAQTRLWDVAHDC